MAGPYTHLKWFGSKEIPLFSSGLDHEALVKSDSQVVSIFAVIVLYKLRPDESATLQSLQQALRLTDSSTLKISILLADNTPGGQAVGDLNPGLVYQAFPENPGLVTPYHLAMSQAEAQGCQWLLTLDQDTQLPPEFLSSMASHARRYGPDGRIAAVVPRIFDRGRPLSPFRFSGGFMPRVLGSEADGVLGPHASALNSASLLRISALKVVQGYDPSFPLNNSDTALYHRLDVAGFRVALAGDVVVQHELAIMSRSDRMTIERYRQLLLDERNFWDLHMSFMARTERLLRLMGRLAKGYLTGEPAIFRSATASEIRKRLFSRRAARISQHSQAAPALAPAEAGRDK